jgi:aspartyl-tRNA synthetase
MFLQAGEQLVHVGQDKRLDNRVIDLRTAANQAIFRIECQVENVSPAKFVQGLTHKIHS